MTGHGAFRSAYWLTSPSSRAGECSFLVARTTSPASNSRAVCTRTLPGWPATSLSRASATATRSADTADSACSAGSVYAMVVRFLAGQPDSGQRLAWCYLCSGTEPSPAVVRRARKGPIRWPSWDGCLNRLSELTVYRVRRPERVRVM
jgi:hypothetical protein